jgi:hypothetical protein
MRSASMGTLSHVHVFMRNRVMLEEQVVGRSKFLGTLHRESKPGFRLPVTPTTSINNITNQRNDSKVCVSDKPAEPVGARLRWQ